MIALEAAQLLEIPEDCLRSVLERNPALWKAFAIEMAATLGVTCQTVNRELQALIRSGVVSQEYGRVTINQPDELRRLVEDLDSLSGTATLPSLNTMEGD